MYGKIVLSVFLFVFFHQESVVCINEVKFGPGSTNTSGQIIVHRRDGRLLPICYRGSDYGREAIVFCHQMGFVGGFPLYIRNGESVSNTAFFEIHCTTGWEQSISECEIIEQPYTEVCGELTIGASCFNTSGARLIGTTQPNIGRLQVEYNDIWADVCFDGGAPSDVSWDYDNLKVACRHLGYPSYMLSIPVAYQFSPIATFADDFKCKGEETILQDCLPDILTNQVCPNKEGVLVSCAPPGYVGCVLDIDPVDRMLPDYENGDDEHPWYHDEKMTIQKCIDTCRRYDTNIQFAGVQQTHCFCGVADIYSGIMSSIVDDSECTYKCSGNAYEICGGGSQLSVYNITAAYCNDPGQIENGRHNGKEFQFGSIVTFECFLGFDLVGEASTQCVVGPNGNGPVWDGIVPECVAKPTEATKPWTIPITTNAKGPNGLSGNDSDFPIEIAAGAAGGGLVIFAILIAIIFFVTRRRKRHPGESHEKDTEHATMNGKSPVNARYSNVPSDTANGTTVKLSTLTRKNDNFVGDKTHAYEQPPPQDVYDYAELPQETYEEVAREEYSDIPAQQEYSDIPAQQDYSDIPAEKEYSDIPAEKEYADISPKDYSEIAVEGTTNQNSLIISPQSVSGVKRASSPPYAKINKDPKNKRQSEHLYNYADVEVPPSESVDEEYADVEIPMLDGTKGKKTGNITDKAEAEEGWTDCIIYDDYDDEGAVTPAANQEQAKNGWVDNDIYNT